MRFFNTEGPVRADDHYILPPLSRWDMDEVMMLIEQKKYFLRTGQPPIRERTASREQSSPQGRRVTVIRG
jgi:hypothetical protein